MMRRMRRTRICVMALAVLITAALPAMAQLTTGSVVGTVKDAQGAVIPGATVTLVSDSRGTRTAPVVTSATGDFVIPNVTVDTYTIEVEMSSFKSLRQSGIQVNPGTRVAVGVLTIEIGGASETVTVKGESPQIQVTSGERSFTIPTDSVQNLPLQNRGFTNLAALAPGVVMSGTAAQALGTTANMSTNITMDGVSTLDTGSNTVMFNMNVESIAEVKILTQGYQAEYGRSSGLQIMAVTKSGTNQFRGSVYNVRRDSDWNSNSKANILNGVAKTISKQQEFGYSIGGPVGKPGGNNKIFFFYAHEYAPRTGGNDVFSFRVPTALERQGDFSQTLDNLGNPYPYIRDPNLSGVCTAADQTACFRDGGVVGRIPANRLYPLGLNILKMWPLPTSSNVVGNNFQFTRPPEDTISYQPAVRVDYQPTQNLRVSFKYQGDLIRKQVNQGTIPGWNDSITPASAQRHGGGDGQLQPEPDDVSRGDLRASREPAGRQRRSPRERRRRRAENRARGSPAALPGRVGPQPGLLRVRDPELSAAPVLGRHPDLESAEFLVGQPDRRQQQQPGRASQHHLPGLHQHQHDPGLLDQPDESHGPAHAEDGLLHHPQPQAGEQRERRRQLRGDQLRQRHRRRQRLRHVLRVRQCGDRLLQLVHAGVRVSGGHLPVQQHRGLHSGQLAGQQQAHTRLRRALRARAAAARCAQAERQFPAGPVQPCRRAQAVCRGLRERPVSVHRHQSPGAKPDHGGVPGTEQHAGHRHARAELRRPEERAVPVGQGDRRHDLQVPDAQRGAALRHGLRSDRPTAVRASRIHRAVLRSAAPGQRPGARRQYIHLEPGDRTVLAAAEPDQHRPDHPGSAGPRGL